MEAFKAAGHVLVLWSGRASACLHEHPDDDPWVVAGIKRVASPEAWAERRKLNLARYVQMVRFAVEELTGLFDHIDDGTGGKPPADLFIDDKAYRLGDGARSVDWAWLTRVYGQPDEEGYTPG